MFEGYKIFQKMAIGVLVMFFGLMGVVTVVAYARTSGTTRQDMSEARFVRQKAVGQKDGTMETAELSKR